MAERERLLGFLRELERADEEVAAVLAELDELAAGVEAVRNGAGELDALFARLPAERRAAEAERARAQEELSAARSALSAAEVTVEQAEGDRLRDAEHFVTRTRDRLSIAERRAHDAAERVSALAESEQSATKELGRLEAKARDLAQALGERRLAEDLGAEPGSGLDGIAEWGSAVRAALFVARGQLAAERDGVIRQANELAAVVLGEPLTSAGAAVIVRRVEEELSG